MDTPSEYPSPAIVDSRRLLGANWYSADAGVVLEVRVDTEAARRAVDHWPYEARALATALGWSAGEFLSRHGRREAYCFMTAPLDGLMTATTVAEQAWVRAETYIAAQDGAQPTRMSETAADDPLPALHAQYAEEHARLAKVVTLVHAARARGLTVQWDDEQVTVGSGTGSVTWSMADVPSPADVPWSRCHNVPTVLVTGSNGKTTTTRLVARMGCLAGRVTGWSSSDGAEVATPSGERRTLASGDYTGPAGARLVLQDAHVEMAVLETARGGILRRGLATPRADVGVITNISLDHLGEYGVESLEDLAEVKGVVARALTTGGYVVLNADDPSLVTLGGRVGVPVAWYSLRADHPLVGASIAEGRPGAVACEGHLLTCVDGAWEDLGAIAAMPLAVDGAATHNVANALAAALAARLVDVPLSAVHATLATFGRSPRDNPGRLRRWDLGGITVLVDYAHNPDGMRALATVARTLPATRRLLVLGQAGNRDDAQLEALARMAWDTLHPDRVILKDLAMHHRNRPPGEVLAVLRAAFLRSGAPSVALADAPDEITAVRDALAWARPGDVLVLPTHEHKQEVDDLLGALVARRWQAGEPV